AASLSSDGALALAIRLTGATGVRVLPTGPGETRDVYFPSLAAIQWATWVPGGRTFILSANEAGHGSRLYLANLDGQLLRTIGPEGTSYQANAVSADGLRVAATDPQGRLTIYQISDGTATTANGAQRDELPVGWSADGTELFLLAPGVPARVVRLDPLTGVRSVW